MADLALSKFTQMVFGYWMSGTVFALVESGTAELISATPLTASTLAEALGAEEEMVQSLCKACAAIGLLSESELGYTWSQLGSRFLASGSPETLVHWVRAMARWQEAWRDLGQAVRDSAKGRRRTGHALTDDAGYERDLALGFYEFASLASEAVADALGIEDGLLVDVGSGPGAYSIAVCRRSPKVRAALIDRQAALEIARGLVQDAGVADRIEFHAADYLLDEYPSPASAVLMSNMLHSEPAENRALLFKRAKAALTSGGQLFIHGHFMGPGGSGVFAALQGLSSSVLWNVGGGITIEGTLSELAAAGFECLPPLPVSGSGTVVLAARKP